jgi:twitching motility protein PilT
VYEIPVNGDDGAPPLRRRPKNYAEAPPPASDGWSTFSDPLAAPSPTQPAAGFPSVGEPFLASAQPIPVADPLFAPPVLAPPVYVAPEQLFAPPPVPLNGPAQQSYLAGLARNEGLNPDPDLMFALQEVLRLTASDLHISVNAPPTLRVDGALTSVPGAVPWPTDKVDAALRSILSPAQQQSFDRELEFDFAFTISANARFRVNLYQQRDVMGAAFRLIPTEIKQLKDLGVPDSVAHFATLPRGLVLVTGPTGSGKSTTLAALVDLVNRTRTDHIMTVEDPIEFLHGNHLSLVNQREVGNDTHSFGAALKHVLRQDPDVILIGELRDLETISVALTAAETGHLVFATLHTQDAPQTVDRVIDVFPPHQQGQVRTQLAATLQGVVCQTLVKRAAGKGRAVATEVLVTTPAVANLIREGKTYQIPTAIQAGRALGMHTMDQHLADLVNEGLITHGAALEKVHDLESFKRLVHRAEPTHAVGQEFASQETRY